MNPDEKTRFLIGTLTAAVIIVVGYGVFQARQAPQEILVRPAAQAIQPQVPSPAAPLPGAPLLRIEAEGPVVAGSAGHKATVFSDVELTSNEWSIQGGVIEGDTRSPSVTWSAGTGTDVVLICQGTNTANKTGTASLRILLHQPPKISRFEAEPKILTEGSTAKLTWSAEHIGKLTLSPGSQDLTNHSGAPLEVKPERSVTYTLTATNNTGLTETRELQLKVVPPPQISVFRAEPIPGSPNTFTVIGEFTGGKAELKQGSLVVSSLAEGPLRMRLSELKEGASLVLTVTNEAGAYVTSTLNFMVPKSNPPAK